MKKCLINPHQTLHQHKTFNPMQAEKFHNKKIPRLIKH